MALKQLKDIDNRTKYAVYGWIRRKEKSLRLLNVPSQITSICILYYRENRSNVLEFLQLVFADDLKDDEEYGEIVEDIYTECSQYGKVRSITIPRSTNDNEDIKGVGKVFVEFVTNEQASKAKEALHRRTFGQRNIVARYFDPSKYANKDFA